MKLKLPNFSEKGELFDFLVKHKQDLIMQKMQIIKTADAFQSYDGFVLPEFADKFLTVQKAQEMEIDLLSKDKFRVKAAINTTGIFDSYADVHLKGSWKKTAKQNKRWLHVQEHKSNEFSKIISSGEDLMVSSKSISWEELGYDEYKDFADPDILHFDSGVRKDRNAYMHEQYAKGWVNNHSVGMGYVWDKLYLGINDKKYEEEFDTWEKYKEQIVNIKDAENVGYAWFVAEAKGFEGSAVPLGANAFTPTISAKSEPSEEDTQKQRQIEAEKSLQQTKHFFINL